VTVTVRVIPRLPKVMVPVGASVRFDESLETIRLPAA
jgi:hypothetical protein